MFLRLYLVAGLILVLACAAWGEDAKPLQAQRGEVLEQRVKDLMSYRDYLEDQLAAAKAIIARQEQAIAAATASCAKPEAPATPPTKGRP